MLYCPQCGAEYREGYSSCSDCHVLLVHGQPQEMSSKQESVPEPGDPNRDPFCAFWQGRDARVLGELIAVLDEASIPHKTVRREDHLFNRMDQPKLQLGVPASLYEKAEVVVVAAFSGQPLLRDMDGFLPGSAGNKLDFDEDEPAMELQDSPLIKDSGSSRSAALLEDWFPEDATTEVWSGDPRDAWMFEMSFRENEIRFRANEQENQKQLFVLTQDEGRAREIVREIVEATPPE